MLSRVAHSIRAAVVYKRNELLRKQPAENIHFYRTRFASISADFWTLRARTEIFVYITDECARDLVTKLLLWRWRSGSGVEGCVVCGIRSFMKLELFA